MYQADSNQAEIKAALLAVGCSVQLIEGANGQAGVPDMVVGVRGHNYLLEIKRPKGKLSPKQAAWHQAWRGQVHKVETVEEALAVVGLLASL